MVSPVKENLRDPQNERHSVRNFATLFCCFVGGELNYCRNERSLGFTDSCGFGRGFLPLDELDFYQIRKKHVRFSPRDTIGADMYRAHSLESCCRSL